MQSGILIIFPILAVLYAQFGQQWTSPIVMNSLASMGIVDECYQYPIKPLLTESGENKVVLVTGGAGFIGSHVAIHCANLGMKVVILDDLSGGFKANIPDNVEFIKGDIKDAILLEELFDQYQFNYVYHLAAYAAEGLSHYIRSYNYRNNLVGSIELLNMAIKYDIECFIFTSSIAVFGTNQTPMSETTMPMPEDPYGISKYAFELDLQAAHEMFGLDYIIFRPHNVYGPGQNIYDKYRNVLGIFMLQILQNNDLTIFGDGLQTRCFSYIDDIAPIISKSPLYDTNIVRNEVFNIGSDIPTDLNTLAVEVNKAMNKSSSSNNIIHLPERIEVKHAISDHTKINCIFDMSKSTLLKDGIKSTVDWVNEKGTTFNAVEFKGVEIKKNMPPSWLSSSLEEVSIVHHTSEDNIIEMKNN